MKAILGIILMLICSAMLMAQWHINEGFEDITTIPQGWSVFDDGDGLAWRNLQHANAHGGSRAAFADNYLPNQNADWLITPQFNVNAGDFLEFYARAWYGSENLQVYVSTTTAQPGAFSNEILDLQGLGSTYQLAQVDLDSFVNMDIYIGFFWQCSTYGILVDDIKIGQTEIIQPELNLPDSISFFSGETYNISAEEYIVCTDISAVSLSVEANLNINVEIEELSISISAPDYSGEDELVFTLHDNSSGLDVTDTIIVNVLEEPAVDFVINQIRSPRDVEYQNIPLIPQLDVSNMGWADFQNSINIEMQVFSEQNILLYTDSVTEDVYLPAQESVSVSFANSFSPAQEEVLRFVFTIVTSDSYPDNNSADKLCYVLYRHTSGGPDDFGYRFLDSNDPLGPDYEWIDISESGTSTIMYNVPEFLGDDNFSEAIPLGFSFPFYGSSYGSAYVDINGEILLAENSWQTDYPAQGWGNDGNMFNYMYPIPGYSQMPALIAVYWDDLEADEGTGDVYFQTFGTEPDRYAIVQWNDLRFRSGTGAENLLTFQVILHEDGSIKMQYHTVATAQTGASIPHDFGASSTIALQNEAATVGITYLREIVQNNSYVGVEPYGNLLHDNLAILFYFSEDDQAPIIAHDAIGNTLSQDIEIKANIIDMTQPISAMLHYDTGSGWQSTTPTTNSDNNYYFNLTDLPLGSTVNYYFSAEDGEGNSVSLPADAPLTFYSFKVLPTVDAQVLIAFSGNQDYNRIELPIYEALLTELDIAYDIYNWEEYDSYILPTSYKGILAYANTGTANEKMQYFASQLTQYLDSGTDEQPRNLWFASDGLASSQHAHSNSSNIRRLMSGYFRTYYVATGLGGGTNGLAGPDSFSYENGTLLALPGTPVGAVDQEYPVYANSPDCIFPNDAAGDPYFDSVPHPEIGANYIYAFEDGPINGHAYLYHGVAATAVETPSFRALYFSFDFSQLTNPNHRYEWMEDLMDWWNIVPSATDDPQIPASNSGLISIYPNPFNPNTSISYYLEKAVPVRLEIFNLKGQRVKTLLNEQKSAGMHIIAWDGKDNKGNTVASGIYYLSLVTPDIKQARKITMLK
ncbi:MAG: choice-of-anchor J domain-containing protein [Candidatus Cloacimonadaceae bacterium]|jgi:hypothetical protein|nr:choice-of-anchor J domain-containing protein [Candidatus Cloacimonadaceae bacterium]